MKAKNNFEPAFINPSASINMNSINDIAIDSV